MNSTPMPVCAFKPEAHELERFMGPLEAAIMEIVWVADFPSSVKGTWKRLRTTHNPTIAYTTVMTTMNRLYSKGFFDRRKSGLHFVYTARETREAFEERQIAIIMASIERSV